MGIRACLVDCQGSAILEAGCDTSCAYEGPKLATAGLAKVHWLEKVHSAPEQLRSLSR